ncbi:6-phosphogluconolactonase [Arsenophonus endosymbiont of Aleurodicus dispersus]|uniref:6-phosphogluconolactonase n=1 Tax=Arsenophonus endosymbiont of Aleurodicus dispersus TaxID=235559 RepID=UPI000EB25358|nr:6-phosphogluconolactonase [Arsenophonus endosymbiont of Aleurodicus dispersus]VAY02446.1 6-phosphogluconolactonase [Arsenophonus endosymbiont of Aleurodicus dispersus]
MKQVVYVASAESKQIHVWSMDENGNLTLLQQLTLPGEVHPMQISRDCRHLYVGIRPNCAIITYLISAEGKLSKQAITAIHATPTHIEIDRHGRWLFIPSYHQGTLMVLPVDQHKIAQSPIQVISDLKHPHASGVSFDNSRLFVTCLGEDHIRIYIINNNGYLTEQVAHRITTNKGAGPRHLAFLPNQNCFYCLNELDATINVYSAFEPYQQSQKCAILPARLECNHWAADIHITPNGRHLYASERSTSIISHFKVTKDGLELLPITAYATETQPRGFNIDQSGNFLLSAGQKSNHIAVYKINEVTGALQVLKRYPVGKGPMWITTHSIKK